MKIMIFGTFDGIHPGHLSFIKQAKEIGGVDSNLVIVVGLDDTVNNVKGKLPKYSQEERLNALANLKMLSEQDKVILGNSENKFTVIEKNNPDIIALGYDQKSFTKDLSDKLLSRGLNTKIIRLKAYRPEKYKSSILNKY